MFFSTVRMNTYNSGDSVAMPEKPSLIPVPYTNASHHFTLHNYSCSETDEFSEDCAHSS